MADKAKVAEVLATLKTLRERAEKAEATENKFTIDGKTIYPYKLNKEISQLLESIA